MSFLMSSAPLSSSETAPAPSPSPDVAPMLNSRVAPRNPERGLTRCERCGYEWFSRTATPVRCPHCGSRSWNKPRVYKLEGKPDPTHKPKARGASFTSETAQEAAQIRHHGESEAKDSPDQKENGKE